ncbi:hypothetical protein E2C01_068619 [Portunus trituberculatus]|uniref:Uncharacterized protein n=1 Tax=Portunus trituberculatus TaxID=210409 RepID=A0A5B7I0K3_PORTR|nr:hypothetical protein [Portunus trituberculatus]
MRLHHACLSLYTRGWCGRGSSVGGGVVGLDGTKDSQGACRNLTAYYLELDRGGYCCLASLMPVLSCVYDCSGGGAEENGN